MQTFIVTCFVSETGPMADLRLVITPPLQQGENSIVLNVPSPWADQHPFVHAQFEIERRYGVGRCHGSREVFSPQRHGVIVGEIDFDVETSSHPFASTTIKES